MEEQFKKHPWLWLLGAVVVGALFFAGPIAIVIVKAKEWFGGHAAATSPGGGGSKAQESVATKANS